ncbi:peptide deformylase [Aneurinibacillus sp. BA2021]|nr:peptide deformylase [Aneurinibacillus sp. BA2021]
MSIRMIVKHPDPVLREKCKEVTKFTPNLHKLLDDMAETMYDAEGVGLAAPQVGITKRVVVIDVGDGIIEMINPEIIERKDEQYGPEGCLSIPGLLGDVRRSRWVKAKALDRNGNEIIVEGEDLLARAIQHEIDHLNGVLFIDLAEKTYSGKE